MTIPSLISFAVLVKRSELLTEHRKAEDRESQLETDVGP